MSDGRHLLLLTFNYTVALLGLAIFSYKAIIIVMAMGHQLLTINHFKACLTLTQLKPQLHLEQFTSL